jgi:xylulokinase
VLAEAGVVVDSMVGAGGGVLAPLWPQIVSDVCGLPQVVPSVSVGASFGSALLAAGLVSSVDVEEWNPPAVVLQPDPSTREAYDAAYADYRRLYPDTVDVVHRLAARS